MSTQRRILAAVAGAATLLISSIVSAQTPVQPQPRDPNMPGTQNTLPERVEPRANDSTGSTGTTLSEKLQATDGVIRPPADISPDMRVRPPVADPGTTPVIPAPGSPGGNPNVQPR